MPFGELFQTPCGKPVRRQLGAQVRLALARAAHAGNKRPEQPVVHLPALRDPGRGDHHALLVEAGRVGRHAARDLTADIGVVRAGSREAGRAVTEKEGGHGGDVG